MTANTRIDFYVLQNRSPGGRFKLACRVVEKAYRLGLQVYLKTTNNDESQTLDDLLWTFSQSSFIPHELDLQTNNPQGPVLIGEKPSAEDADIVVSIADEPLSDFEEFSRIADVIGFENEDKSSGRYRFRYYRDHGIEPMTHHINL